MLQGRLRAPPGGRPACELVVGTGGLQLGPAGASADEDREDP